MDLSESEQESVRGSEVLLVDRDERVREGFSKLLSAEGILVTSTADPERARELASRKFFSVAVLDADTPYPGEGLQLLEDVQHSSPNTQLVLLTAAQTFEAAATAFRVGAKDVVAKTPQNVRHLTATVLRLCTQQVRADATKTLLGDVLELHELLLRKLMAASREGLIGAGSSDKSGRIPKECVVLVVDDNPRNGPGLQRALGKQSGYRVVSAMTGGEALDHAGTDRFNIALVKHTLPDLPSSMVVNSIKTEVPEGIVLLFSPPTDKPGRVDIIETSGPIELIADLRGGDQLVACLNELREAYWARLRERRYLQAFREEHFELLRSYANLRRRIAAAIGREADDVPRHPIDSSRRA